MVIQGQEQLFKVREAVLDACHPRSITTRVSVSVKVEPLSPGGHQLKCDLLTLCKKEPALVAWKQPYPDVQICSKI